MVRRILVPAFVLASATTVCAQVASMRPLQAPPPNLAITPHKE
jgi:hypothetical protein